MQKCEKLNIYTHKQVKKRIDRQKKRRNNPCTS